MFPDIAAYIQAKHEAHRLPRRSVDRRTFVKLAMASGMDERDAAVQAHISRVMGASVRLGDEMVTCVLKVK